MNLRAKKTLSFSLIEVMVLCSLVMLFALYALPHFSFLRKEELYSAVDLLAATCSFLQQRASLLDNKITLVIDYKNHSYSYEEHARVVVRSLPSRVIIDYIPGVCGPPSKPISPITHPLSFPTEDGNRFVITFFPDMSVSCGSLYMCDSAKNVMVALCYPLGNPGSLGIYRYEHTTWKRMM